MPMNENVALHGEHGGFAYAHLASNVARELTRALNREKEFGLTRAEIAKRLGIDKSAVTRCMSGSGNLTLRTVAALFAAMGYQVEVSARRIDAPAGDRASNRRDPVNTVLSVGTAAPTAKLAVQDAVARLKVVPHFEYGS